MGGGGKGGVGGWGRGVEVGGGGVFVTERCIQAQSARISLHLFLSQSLRYAVG